MEATTHVPERAGVPTAAFTNCLGGKGHRGCKGGLGGYFGGVEKCYSKCRNFKIIKCHLLHVVKQMCFEGCII
jgi:hypothetical protein